MSTYSPAIEPNLLRNSRKIRGFKRIRTATIQKFLNDLGYDTQDAYGDLGQETQNAILWFQSENAIRVDGKINSQLVALMQKKRNALQATIHQLRSGNDGDHAKS